MTGGWATGTVFDLGLEVLLLAICVISLLGKGKFGKLG